jgi:hypothetical protein
MNNLGIRLATTEYEQNKMTQRMQQMEIQTKEEGQHRKNPQQQMREEMEQRIKQSEVQQTELAHRHKMEFQELIQRLALTESEQNTMTNRITTKKSLAKRQSQRLTLVETEQINASNRTTALESQPTRLEDSIQVEDKMNSITQ